VVVVSFLRCLWVGDLLNRAFGPVLIVVSGVLLGFSKKEFTSMLKLFKSEKAHIFLIRLKVAATSLAIPLFSVLNNVEL
jgi:hypothetical protein